MIDADADRISWKAHARVLKFSPDQAEFAAGRLCLPVASVKLPELRRARIGAPELGIAEAAGNVLTIAGIARLVLLIIGGAQAMTPAQMMVGVGDTATAGLAADTDMNAATGSTHRYIQGSDSGFPSVAGTVISGQSTFTGANGNHAWNEWAWGIATGTLTPGTGSWSSIAATSAVMLNHKAPAALGAKSTGMVWALQSTVTLTIT
jgi:hypothetical protein